MPESIYNADLESEGRGAYEPMSLARFLCALVEHKFAMILLPIFFGGLAALIGFITPNWYRATATILPPQQTQSSAAAMLGEVGTLIGLAGGAGAIRTPEGLYIGMLKSRAVADAIVKRFGLKEVYEVKLDDAARGALALSTRITAGKEGLITIEFEDKDPKRAAAVANAYAEELTRLTKTLAVTDASRRRLFLEHQLQSTRDNLEQAESRLRTSLDAHGVVSVDAQTRAMVETIAHLRAQITAKEIELGGMRSFATTENPQYRSAQQALETMRAQMSVLENGADGGKRIEGEAENSKGLKNVQILREVKYNEMLYEMLAKQYEVARLDEAKDATIIQVLDAAQVPERKAGPKRALMILAGLAAGFAVALAWVLMRASIMQTWGEMKALRKQNR